MESCKFCPDIKLLKELMGSGWCDEKKRTIIRSKRLKIPGTNTDYFKDVVRDADRYFTWWAQKPIIIPAYNYLGRALNEQMRLTWTEDGVRKHLKQKIDEYGSHIVNSHTYQDHFDFLGSQ